VVPRKRVKTDQQPQIQLLDPKPWTEGDFLGRDWQILQPTWHCSRCRPAMALSGGLDASWQGSRVEPPGSGQDRHLAADTDEFLTWWCSRTAWASTSIRWNSSTAAIPRRLSRTVNPAPLSSADPLLAYYRGFCREKLGQSGAADCAAASRMPLL
jgi:hypothetical protein